jgi:hypothetical protein
MGSHVKEMQYAGGVAEQVLRNISVCKRAELTNRSQEKIVQ